MLPKIVLTFVLTIALTGCSSLRLMKCPHHVEGIFYKCEAP